MIDVEKVMRLHRRGKLQREIAMEMSCSRVQVSRIINKHRAPLDDTLHYYARQGDEFKVWYALASDVGVTLNDIANYVGVSVQYVQEKITPYLRRI